MTTVIVGVVCAAGLAVIGWFFRAWARDVGDKVDRLTNKVEKLDEKVDGLSEDMAQVKVVIGWPPHLQVDRRR